MKEHVHASTTRKRRRVVTLFIISVIFVAIACAIALVGYNYVINRSYTETFYNVSSLKVNNKIRVLQISDLHSTTYGKNNQEITKRAQNLNPDVIILTGDCIDSAQKQTDSTVAFCAELAKLAPTYYIYGNNEIERCYGIPLTQVALDEKFGFNNDNRDPQQLIALADPFAESLTAAGVTVLKNQTATITVNNTPLDIFGVLTANPSSFWSYAGTAFESYLSSNSNNLKITAIHEPLVFQEYTPETWGDVILAGHTHGGLIRFPKIGPLYTQEAGILPARSGAYVYGRYEVQGSPLIVNSGLDNQTFLRINNQPELVIVDINRF